MRVLGEHDKTVDVTMAQALRMALGEIEGGRIWRTRIILEQVIEQLERPVEVKIDRSA